MLRRTCSVQRSRRRWTIPRVDGAFSRSVAGVHFREGANGRRTYEISFTDSTGRRRWRVIGTSLRDAVAAREELRSRVRRGERVAPSRATLAEAAEAWLSAHSQLRPKTREGYETHLRVHVLPRLGRLRVAQIDEDAVAGLIAEMQAAGSAAWTIRGALTPLRGALGYAVRRGLIASNPVSKLERGERPAAGRREQRVLDADEIGRLLAAASPLFRPLLATAVFTGLRLGELLGLRWQDVDLAGGVLHVRAQLDRRGCRVAPKTPQALRSVELMPSLARTLREHKLASPYSRPGDPVFASEVGTPLHWRNVPARGLAPAVRAAGLDDEGRPRLRFHDLRHTAASLLIAEGLDVVFVSRQLGHASPTITLAIYAHLFDRARHAERAREALEARFGAVLAALES